MGALIGARAADPCLSALKARCCFVGNRPVHSAAAAASLQMGSLVPCLKVRELSARADDLALQLVEANEQVL